MRALTNVHATAPKRGSGTSTSSKTRQTMRWYGMASSSHISFPCPLKQTGSGSSTHGSLYSTLLAARNRSFCSTPPAGTHTSTRTEQWTTTRCSLHGLVRSTVLCTPYTAVIQWTALHCVLYLGYCILCTHYWSRYPSTPAARKECR